MHLRFYEEPLDNGGILTCDASARSEYASKIL